MQKVRKKEHIMLSFENQNIEFKQEYVPDIRKEEMDFELCRSMNQELTFHTLQAEMQKRLIELGTSQMRTLKLIGEDGLYTNLALLLSDQCETTTKVALF